jgi:hypothetical protein
MDEIKAVRVRRSDVNVGTLDIKVTIYSENRTFGPDERIVVGFNNDRPVWIATTYKKTASYKNFTDDQFIKDFIDMNSKMDGGKTYNIIQDPWENKVPIIRNYGSDPYYLNNGALVYILWQDKGKDAGGRKFSDDKGVELPITDTYVEKTIKIISSNETQGFTLGKNGEFEYSTNSQVYVSTIKDSNILSEIISKWKIKVDNYDLSLCSPDNESCSIIPYKSPLKPIVSDVPTTPVAETAINADSKKKEPIKINLQDEKVKVKVDVLSLKVYIGILKDSPLEKPLENETLNNEQDEFIDGEGSEYIEEDFIGEEEKWNPIPGIDDTFDPDTDKGGDNQILEPQSFVPATQTQKDFIKTAIQATLSKGEKHGKCARFTFNHVNNYVRLMQGKPVEKGDVHNAGGNANQPGYHKNLQNMGYKITINETISKSNLISKISNGSWSIGDVIVYWCTDGPANASHVIYGHTQIFTNGYHNGSNYRWSTDNMNNYESAFVYRKKSGDTYKFIHFQAPKTKKIQDTV